MKISPKRKKAIVMLSVVIALFLALILIFKVAGTLIFESKTALTVPEVRYVANKIFRENMGFRSSITIYFWDYKIDGAPDNPKWFGTADPTLLTSQNFYISSNGGDGLLDIHYDPTEITASFECLLYFQEKNLPGELIGIMNAQTVGGIDNYRPNISSISVTEFEELCAEVDIEGLSRRKAAEKLAERWIEKHNYVKK